MTCRSLRRQYVRCNDNGSRTAGTRFLESQQLFFREPVWRSTFMPISSASCIRLLLVMEGRMEVDFGVIYVLSLMPKKLAAPHSSMYFFSLHPDRTHRHNPNRALSCWHASWTHSYHLLYKYRYPMGQHGQSRIMTYGLVENPPLK